MEGRKAARAASHTSAVGFAGVHPPDLFSCAFTARGTELGANKCSTLPEKLPSDHCCCWLQHCYKLRLSLSQTHMLPSSQKLMFIEHKCHQGHVWQRNPAAQDEKWQCSFQKEKSRVWQFSILFYFSLIRSLILETVSSIAFERD